MAKIVEMTSGLLTIYKYLLLASVVISWVNADPYNPIVHFIVRVTEPVLQRVRRYMPNTGIIDFSPLVVFALIYLVQIIFFDTAYTYLIIYGSQLKGQIL
jgi:YggT family protein